MALIQMRCEVAISQIFLPIVRPLLGSPFAIPEIIQKIFVTIILQPYQEHPQATTLSKNFHLLAT